MSWEREPGRRVLHYMFCISDLFLTLGFAAPICARVSHPVAIQELTSKKGHVTRETCWRGAFILMTTLTGRKGPVQFSGFKTKVAGGFRFQTLP